MRRLMVAALIFSSMSAIFAQEENYREERLCATVEADIQHSEGYTRSKGKDRERADNALRHLSDFDSAFQRGKFDKGKLDQAIDDVKNLADNNPMGPEDRRLLLEDLRRLREFRARRG
jgi:hypothetical protein